MREWLGWGLAVKIDLRDKPSALVSVNKLENELTPSCCEPLRWIRCKYALKKLCARRTSRVSTRSATLQIARERATHTSMKESRRIQPLLVLERRDRVKFERDSKRFVRDKSPAELLFGR